MISNAQRAQMLARALRAIVAGDESAVRAVFADDARVWTPGWTAASLTELCANVGRIDEAFTDIDSTITPLDVGGAFAAAEWQVTMSHTGPIAFGTDVVEPTGLRVTVRGCAVAEFVDGAICALRQYWDEASVLEQLGLIARTG